MTVTLAAPPVRLAWLQAPGAIGPRTYMSSAISDAPIQVSLADLRAVAP